MRTLLAICHPGGGTSGVFHGGARAGGCTIEEWTPATEPAPQRELASYCGLIVLGGDQNVSEQERYPYLVHELALMRDWIADGRPLLGVCLGAELLAAATGGAVPRLPRRAFGWLGVELGRAGRADPVLGFGDPGFTAFEWHSYGIEPPPGATVLATSAGGVEAFRIGRAWGVQYHPEVDAAILGEWSGDLRASGEPGHERDLAVLADGLPLHLAAWNAYGRELSRRFAQSAL